MTEPITVRVQITVLGQDTAWRTLGVKLDRDAENNADLLRMFGRSVAFALEQITAEIPSTLSNDLR